MQKKKPSVNNDNLRNTITGMGLRGADKRVHSYFDSIVYPSDQELENIYRCVGVGKRIIDIYATEMTRAGWDISGDPDGQINSKIESMHLLDKIADMVRWARLFGGAIILLGIDDGNDFDEPVNLENIQDIQFAHVFDKSQITFEDSDFDLSPASAAYGNPVFYNITLAGEAKTKLRVHESRILRMDGAKVSYRTRMAQRGWSDSEIYGIYNELKNFCASVENSAIIVEDFITAVLTINNLGDLIAAGKEDVAIERGSLISFGKSNLKTVLLDAEESYTKNSASISGLPELLDRFMQSLSSVCSIPVSILMGRSAAGMNATGDLDIRSFYDAISQAQETKLRPSLERLVNYLFACKSVWSGPIPDNWKIEFNPLWQMSDLDTANLRKIVADTDAVYISNGVLDPDEVAENRFGGDRYSMDTTIDMEDRAGDIEQGTAETDSPLLPNGFNPEAVGPRGVDPTNPRTSLKE